MTSDAIVNGGRSGFAALRRFVPNAPRAEICGMCALKLSEAHQHLVDLDSRSLVCVCDACSILFPVEREGRYKRVPRRTRRLSDFHLSEGAWESLAIPIDMAFLFYNSRASKPVAVYPSPAGATESSVPESAWADIVASAPILEAMQPDVEALLVNRLAKLSVPEYYITPIDECYKLVGLVRTHWRGLAGGTKVWQELHGYFEKLRKSVAVNTREAARA